MSVVELEDVEWQTVLAMLALAPWRDANPLLMKIGQQLRTQQAVGSVNNSVGNSKEIQHG